MKLHSLATASEALAAAGGSRARVALLADVLREAGPQLPLAATLLAGDLPNGRIGVGPAQLVAVRGTPAAPEPTLTLDELVAELDRFAAIAGSGARDRRAQALSALWSRATTAEQDFLGRLLFGELRQGARGSLVIDAIADATGTARAAVRRAAMLSGDLAATGRAAQAGADALGAIRLQLFRPLSPMLASPCESPEEAVEALGTARLELKLDGARVQVHRDGDVVKVYSRLLNDVTAAVPEVVEAARALPADRLVLDGEAICLRPDGRPLPFQDTMRRFGRKLDVEQLRAQQPIAPFFFDLLHLDGEDLLDAPLRRRAELLERVVPEPWRVESTHTEDPAVASARLEDALARGHEGLIAKDLEAPWAAGSRGSAWLKLKAAHTLDLVVLAAEWGSGRRRGWLSNLHLGARDPERGFAMLGKTFKGLTDETLAWQTRELLAREVRRTEWVVTVRPELVVEIAFNDVQQSPTYPSGLALRFARVKGYRPDKTPDDADTLDAVRAIFEAARPGADE